MQNHVTNIMQFRKKLLDEGLPSYGGFVTRCNQRHKKDGKLKDFHFLSICEEGESPGML